MKSFVALATLATTAFAQVPPNTGHISYLTAEAAAAGAVCLDGTPAAYYFRAEAETTKFYIHQEGGGWCNSDSDCYSRSQGALGSSKSYAQSVNMGSGYFSNDPKINPMMYNWTKIFLKYCDGGSQTGDLSAPVAVPGKGTIYYRGARVIRSLISNFLANSTVGVSKATDVVISGCSAGGLSTFFHADKWTAALPAAKVVAMPDSGFFLRFNASATFTRSYQQEMEWLFAAMNSTGGLPAACIAANPANPSVCIFAEGVSPTLKTPFFPLQSQFDSWQIGNDLFNNSNVAVNNYGALLVSRVETDLLAKNPSNGIFLDACEHHCGNEWDTITIDGDTQSAAFGKWYASVGKAGAKQEWKQAGAFPCAACCKAADSPYSLRGALKYAASGAFF